MTVSSLALVIVKKEAKLTTGLAKVRTDVAEVATCTSLVCHRGGQ